MSIIPSKDHYLLHPIRFTREGTSVRISPPLQASPPRPSRSREAVPPHLAVGRADLVRGSHN
jgi:hypothetical protein